MEAVKVCIQTQHDFARGLVDGLPKLVRSAGALGLYKGLVPIWRHQIQFTMISFACFEIMDEVLLKDIFDIPKNECSKPEQVFHSFTAGYAAGLLSAFVSHPTDIFSFLKTAYAVDCSVLTGLRWWCASWTGRVIVFFTS